MKTVTVKIIYSPYPPAAKDVVWGHRVDGKVEFKIFGDEGWTVVAKEDIISDIESATESAEEYTNNAIQEAVTEKLGAVDGIATLDSAGKVPSSQLPSYVDDVVEYDSLSDFPEEGETGKIYVAKDTGLVYRWSGSEYFEISNREQEQADWAVTDEQQVTFIKNKTHWLEIVQHTVVYCEGDFSWYKYTDYCYIFDLPTFSATINSQAELNQLEVKIGYSTLAHKYVYYNSSSGWTLSDNYNNLVCGSSPGSFYHYESYNRPTAETVHIKISRSWTEYIYHTLDERFIPDTIARTADIITPVQSDWHQTDNTSLDFILNRPAVKIGDVESAVIEGDITNNIANDTNAHAEGTNTAATGLSAHAEGGTNGSASYLSSLTRISDREFSTSGNSSALRNMSFILQGVKYKIINAVYDSTPWKTYITVDKDLPETLGTSIKYIYSKVAAGNYSHTEGYNTTAKGDYAHAEGYGTLASSRSQHVGGEFNVEDSYFANVPSWTPSTAYDVGDIVYYGNLYKCKSAHTSHSSFDRSETIKWKALPTKGIYLEIIGNGTDEYTRSNARTLDWEGNHWLAGTDTALDFILKNDPNVTLSSIANIVNNLPAAALSGSYGDLTDTPDLSVYALAANLAAVATSGDYTDLSNTPDFSATEEDLDDIMDLE